MIAPLRDAIVDVNLSSAFGRTAAVFPHDFVARPDLTVEALASVAGRLPASWVLAHEAQHSPHDARGAHPPRAGGSVREIVREIAHSHASVRIYNLERTAEFGPVAATLRPVVDSVVGSREGGVQAMNLGAFVASAGSTTPAHPDRHHNFLLQVQGRKEVWIEDDPDAARAHYVRVLDYLRRPEAGVAVLPPARSFVLNPGDAVYIPPYVFHWTQLFDEPGVALSIGFSTSETVRRGNACEFDRRLRQLGWRLGWRPRPAPVGSVRGRAKARLGAAFVRRSASRNARSVTVTPSLEGPDDR